MFYRSSPAMSLIPFPTCIGDARKISSYGTHSNPCTFYINEGYHSSPLPSPPAVASLDINECYLVPTLDHEENDISSSR